MINHLVHNELTLPYRIALIALVGVVLGYSIVLGLSWLTIGILAAVILASLLVKAPEFGVLGIIVLNSTVLGDNANLGISIGFGHIYLTDVLLFGLLGWSLIRWLADRRWSLNLTPLDAPLALFLLVTLVSTGLAMSNSLVTLNEALGPIRAVNSFLVFFAVTNLVRTAQQVNTLWRGILFLALITAIAMVIQLMVGVSVPLLPGRVERLVTEGRSFSAVTRSIPPGDSLMFIASMVLFAITIHARTAGAFLKHILVWCLLTIGVVLTFERHLFIGAAFAGLIMLCVVRWAEKLRLLFVGTAVVLASMLLALSTSQLAADPSSTGIGTAVTDRISSLMDPATYADVTSSLRWRDFEYQYGLAQVISHPVVGLGLDTIYRPWIDARDWLPDGDYRRFIHNGHLAILVRTGVLGYFLFAWMSIAFIWRGIKYWHAISDAKFRPLVLGLTLGYVAALIAAVVSPIPLEANWTPVLAIAFGTNEALFRIFGAPRSCLGTDRRSSGPAAGIPTAREY